MEFTKNKFEVSKGRFKILLTFIATLVGLVVVIQALTFAQGKNTSLIQAQSPVVTPTLTTEEAIQAYIEGHIIRGDVMPEADPGADEAEEAIVSPQEVANDVDLSGPTAMIGDSGDLVNHTLTLLNTGTEDDTYVVTAASEWTLSLPEDRFTVPSGSAVSVNLIVTVPPAAMNGDFDTAVLTATSQTDAAVTAAFSINTVAGSEIIYFPLIFKPLTAPTLTATRPNNANDWQMNWPTAGNTGVTGYELQQSQDASFATGVTTYNLADNVSSQLINTVQPSANNIYYFRLRSLGSNSQFSPWSSVVTVIGAYFDTFNNNQTGWSGSTLKEGLRRLTYIEEEDAWYENNDWLIIRIEDSWDWAIASPMKPAPEPPYMIEFRSMPANLGNLVSHGVVFGGDWAGAPCPDWSTVQGVYAHNNCFNHFYNTNLIWSSSTDLTLLWERVDFLVYCPTCGGSPLKRLGDVPSALPFHPNASGWNDYRIEVRSSDIKFYLNGSLRFTYNDTRWINDPYFGVFASTDEYSNSTWRYEYIRVTPLDN